MKFPKNNYILVVNCCCIRHWGYKQRQLVDCLPKSIEGADALPFFFTPYGYGSFRLAH